MSKKFLLVAALVAGSSTSALAAADMKSVKDAEAKPAPEATKKATKAKKPTVKQTHSHNKAAKANGLTVTLGGSLDTQYGHRKQKKSYDTVKPGVLPVDEATSKTNKHAIVNDTKVSVKAEGNANGMKYGGKVVLNADSSGSKYGWNGSDANTSYSKNDNIAHETKVWVGTKFGKLEAGTTTGAYASMHVNAASIARATGGIDGDAQYWFNPFLYSNTVTSQDENIWVPEHFVVNPNLPSNYVHGLDAHAAKITYYTPSYMGFKLGASYTPDSEQRGTSAKTQSVFRNISGSTSLTGYKDMWEGGVSYKGKFDQVGVRASLTGNAADAKNLANMIPSSPIIQRHDLRAWEGGAALDFMGFTLAGSYGDLGKSGSAKTYDGIKPLIGKNKANFWTTGLSYECHAFGTSVTYLESHHGAAAIRDNNGVVNNILALDTSNKYKALSFGVDYKLAPGFMPYAEVTAFTLKQGKKNQEVLSALIQNGIPESTGLTKQYKNSGAVVLAGTKLQF